jgi:hypothetical protein
MNYVSSSVCEKQEEHIEGTAASGQTTSGQTTQNVPKV